MSGADRREELADGVNRARRRIAAACAECGRDPAEITLIVVTKFFPARDVRLLVELGVRDIGENRDQEAGAKVAALAEAGCTPRVHFIGQVQSNKAGHIARYADVIHSVDRRKLVAAVDRGAQAAGRRLDVLLQVCLDDAPGRGGAAPADVPALADAVAAAPHLDLRGVMAVAPLGAEPGPAFASLARVHEHLLADHPDATWRSAGMSGDLEAAVVHGATHLRVGSAILGPRPEHG